MNIESLPKCYNLVNPQNQKSLLNQIVCHHDNKWTFSSHGKTICVLTNGEVYLCEDWNYSHTTLKALYIFLDSFSHYYKMSKKEIEKNLESGYFLKLD